MIETQLFILFLIIIVGFLTVDLGFLNKKAHRISTASAIIQSIFWVVISLIFAGLILFLDGHSSAAEFLSAYLTEKMLSVDNLFVMMLIFRYFKLPEKYHHKVLFWGILGAVIFRGVFITAGAALVHQFHWILYIFGVLLTWTGVKLLRNNEDESIDIENNKVLKLARRYLPLTTKDHQGKFFVKDKGRWVATMLFVIVLIIETTDIMFAFDSIPAAFAISQNPFIVFTSNIFAVMGLRALFFLVENILNKFRYLQKGLSFVLIFIGVKMIGGLWGLHIDSLVSLFVIVLALIASLSLSVLIPEKNKEI